MTNLHIHAPKSEYLGQVRKRGARRWTTVTAPLPSSQEALRSMAYSMAGYHFGRVIMCQEYYDPVEVITLRKP